MLLVRAKNIQDTKNYHPACNSNAEAFRKISVVYIRKSYYKYGNERWQKPHKEKIEEKNAIATFSHKGNFIKIFGNLLNIIGLCLFL